MEYYEDGHRVLLWKVSFELFIDYQREFSKSMFLLILTIKQSGDFIRFGQKLFTKYILLKESLPLNNWLNCLTSSDFSPSNESKRFKSKTKLSN